MRLYAILLVAVLVVSSCKREVYYHASPPLYRTGDNPGWSQENLKTSGWRKQRVVTKKPIYWARINVTITRELDPAQPLGIKISALGSYQFYWDGVEIGRNGQPVSPQNQEIPGLETMRFMLPDSLAGIGPHVAAFRLSQSYHTDDLRDIEIDLQNYVPMIRDPLLIAAMMNLIAGIFLVTSLYYLSLYLNTKYREKGTLVFAITCVLFFTLLILEYLVEYLPIPYNWYFTRSFAISVLTLGISLSVPYYFTLRFSYKYSAWFMVALLGILLTTAVLFYQRQFLMNHLFSYLMWLALFFLAAQAVIRRVMGARSLLAALLLSAAVNWIVLYDSWLFISYALIAVGMLYLQTFQIRKIEQEYQAAIELSSRLKLDLLKKHIQPHFIKNTLTSLIDWVEHSPKEGVLFLHALAKEFDILNRICDATLIPIETEIALCRTHLAVMQFRKETSYVWENSAIDVTEYLPPAILHTMVENGITHSKPGPDNRIVFRLTYVRNDMAKEYHLLIVAKNRNGRHNAGTGFEYIKSRLSESYGSNWMFSSEEVAEGWLNTIKILAL